MEQINNINCCGCSACADICPKRAIKMVSDSKGFLYPVIDKELCIDCGSCLKVCSFRNFIPKDVNNKSFICYLKDEKLRKESQSGGAFMILCDYVLENSGYIFGATMEDMRVFHKCYNNYNDVKKFRGSKYVQSYIENTYSECKRLLEEGKLVLFSGTPCQTHGLLAYLNFKKINIKNLITVDIICHGTPSQQLWLDYIKILEKKYKSKVTEFNFRDKKYGWHNHFETISFNNGKTIKEDRWANAFYSHKLLRESCFNCKYTTPNRLSDFTIADCWGIEKVNPSLDSDSGLSLLIAHNLKAINIIQKLNSGVFIDVKLNDVIQPQLLYPPKKSQNYNIFWDNYFENKNKALKSLFCYDNKLTRVFNRIKRKLFSR